MAGAKLVTGARSYRAFRVSGRIWAFIQSEMRSHWRVFMIKSYFNRITLALMLKIEDVRAEEGRTVRRYFSDAGEG